MQLPGLRINRYAAAVADGPVPAAQSSLVTGLTLAFQDATGQTLDARDARLIALSVPAGQSASPLLPAGVFQAVWSGVLTNRIKDTCRFAAEGRGDLTVTLNDKTVLELHGGLTNHPAEPVVVRKGKNKLVVTYKSPADGDAMVRLLWAPSGKPFEPVTMTTKQMQLVHDSADQVLVAHQALRAGVDLVASSRCAACHQGVTGSMPELQQDAPNLDNLKSRLNQTWMAYWISNPRALRPSASMPRVFHDRTANPEARLIIDDRAGDIASYLSPPEPAGQSAVSDTDPDTAARGARLFTGLGCVACHVPPNLSDSDPSLNRVPLKYVGAKFKPDALKAFLEKPEMHYAWIKMPNFHLSAVEVTALSQWLLSSCSPDALPTIKKQYDPVNGKKLFESIGCLNCHGVGNTTPSAAAAVDFVHADFTHGCIADDRDKNLKGVDFGFTPEQIADVRAFKAADWQAVLKRDSLPEFTARQMPVLRCSACHSMDGVDSIWSNLDADISAIEKDLPARAADDPEPKGDQSRPPLTWAGEKLRPAWTEQFIAGQISYKPRTWLFARMPSFASRAPLLSKGMALTHACPEADEARPAPDAKLADIGKSLTSQTGLGCVKCHAVADQAALAPFEAEAPNLAHVDARLRHDYFSRWMRDPQYFLPGTKMPSFANVDGQTPLKDILGGDATAEYEAVWNYLRNGEKIEPAQ